MNSRKIVEALTSNAACAFDVNLTTGMVEQAIMGSDGKNLSSAGGFTPPFSFNNLMHSLFIERGVCKIVQGPLDSCDYVELLMEDYLSGQTRREINVFFTPANSYYRVIFFMYEDDESGYIRAFVISRRIVQVEDEVFAATGQQKSQGQKETEIFYKNLLDFQACGIFDDMPIEVLGGSLLAIS